MRPGLKGLPPNHLLMMPKDRLLQTFAETEYLGMDRGGETVMGQKNYYCHIALGNTDLLTNEPHLVQVS